MNAIDTNLLFYSLDADEVVKQPLAVALLGQLTAATGTVLPWQVACEQPGPAEPARLRRGRAGLPAPRGRSAVRTSRGVCLARRTAAGPHRGNCYPPT